MFGDDLKRRHKSIVWLVIAHWNQIEQFALTLEKKTMASNMWKQRINDNADREGWWLEIRDNGNSSVGDEDGLDDKNDSTVVDEPLEKKVCRMRRTETVDKNEYAIEDEEDDDDDDDENGTTYWRALLDPPASHEVFSNTSLPSSTLSVDSYVTVPCTLSSMSLEYMSFNRADDVE